MKRPPLPYMLLLPLLAVLLFGNCAQNVYRVLGPGTTPAQVARLKQINEETSAAYRAAFDRPTGQPGPTPEQVIDSGRAAQQRLLTPEQYRRYKTRYSPLPLRYPRRPPRHY
ncbi:hypothetical protein MUN81_05515 [Hymenobacter sp. 5317J-9]|uniref:hypothetical protein n=1 Tax=Hymenobacter sp. 5317J-9 TaxID=2932250 RepID=UPI001FD6B1EC|nr:hypothetical protein [Hymenobacter sp. 5317J-9]UOQ98949.1 hypothetical protein MUN81_05515 [Hymenobacter sp. 5317J-9]